MNDRTSNKSQRLKALLQRIAYTEERPLHNLNDLQSFVEELMERGVIVREGPAFRIRWEAIPRG